MSAKRRRRRIRASANPKKTPAPPGWTTRELCRFRGQADRTEIFFGIFSGSITLGSVSVSTPFA